MNTVTLRYPGRVEYESAYQAMQAFNRERRPETPDEIWYLEHQPVYTLGLSGRMEHILDARGIPVVQTDRGGQVTYHGPGQLVVYLLLDLKRSGIGIRDYVQRLEQAVIDTLAGLSLDAERRAGAPGVYVDGRKIAALGVRVRGGGCYHGLALNVDMDLAPFEGINPCGYESLEVTQISDYGTVLGIREAAACLLPELMKQLGYERHHTQTEPPRHLAGHDRRVVA